MLKHAIEEHQGEDVRQVKFGIRAMAFCRSSFERQIMEACKIQEERIKHVILNSKSEFNRSAVPRIMTKLGDKEYEKYGKEKSEEKRKEEEIEEKIRELRKERNKEHRPCNKDKPAKRRKIDEEKYVEEKEKHGAPDLSHRAKRQGEEQDQPRRKMHKTSDTQGGWGGGGDPEMDEAPLQNKKSQVGNILRDDDEDTEEITELSEMNKGREGFYDMEKIQMEREKERETMEQMEAERKGKAERLKAIWGLARLCREILRESESWDERAEEIKNNIERESGKGIRIEKAKEKKQFILTKYKQGRIDKMFDELSKKGKEEWERITSNEERKARLDLKEMKENLWKWRESGKERKEKKDNKEKSVEEKLKNIEEILEKETLERKIAKERRKAMQK